MSESQGPTPVEGAGILEMVPIRVYPFTLQVGPCTVELRHDGTCGANCTSEELAHFMQDWKCYVTGRPLTEAVLLWLVLGALREQEARRGKIMGSLKEEEARRGKV